MLDNTVVLFGNHFTDGKSHNGENLPWVMAGSCGGYFKTGRFLRQPIFTPTTKLLAGLAAAMDVPLPNDTFGDPAFAGLIPGLSG